MVLFRHIFISYQFHWDTKLNEITEDHLPKSIIIGFLEVYNQLMHCFVVFPPTFSQIFD